MDRRTGVFALIGAAVVAPIASIVGVGLDAAPVACSSGGLLMVCTAPRIHVLGTRLSEMEIVGWSIIVGAVVGGLLGYAIALLTRRGSAHATPSSAPEAPRSTRTAS